MRITATLLALTLATGACGKDEPKPAAPSTAPATTAPTTPAPETKAPEAKADPSKPDVASKPAAPATPARSAAVPVQAELSSQTLATLPLDILAVGGVQNPRALMDAFLVQAKRVPGLTQTADPLDFVLGRVKEAFGVQDLSWLALDKPVRFAVPNPKKYPDGFIQIYALVAGAKLEPTQFASAKANDEGHWASLPAGERKVFVDLANDLMVVTSHPGLFKEQADFIAALSLWLPSAPLVLEASASNARVAFASELTELQGNIDSLGKQLADAGLKEEQLKMLKTFSDGAFGVLTGLERIGLAVDVAGDFPRLAFSFRAVEGSAFAKTTTELRQRRPTLASLVPQDAWLAFVYDFDIAGLVGDQGSLAAMLNSDGNAKWSPDEIKAFLGFITKMSELQRGNSAFWVTKSGNFPLAIESVGSSSDGPAQRDALIGLLNLVFQKQWGAARASLIADGGPADKLPGTDFKEFVTAAGQLGRVFGVTPTLPKIEGADTLALDFDWSRLGNGKIPPALRDALVNMVGSHLELALAASPTRVVAAFGPYAANRAIELGALSADAVPQDPWLAQAAKDHFAVLSLRPTRLARALLDLPQMAQVRDTILAMPDDPLLITGASDGTAINVTFSLPVDMLIGFFSAF